MLNEFVMLTEKQSVGLVMDPLAAEERKGRSIFSYFMPSSEEMPVAFLYPKSPDTSDWIYAHDTLGAIMKTFRMDEDHLCGMM